MLSALTRMTFSMLASSVLLRKAATHIGMRRPGSPARRFVAGEQRDDAFATARTLEKQGLSVTLRQYPCGDELTTQMLRDLDVWLMEQVTGVVTSEVVEPAPLPSEWN